MKASNEAKNTAEDYLDRLRHSLSHIMAAAVLEIRPQAKLGFGPAIENGFYYDFDFGAEPITEDDLKDLEKQLSTENKEKK